VQRRRLYLMRHAEVRYFEGVPPAEVALTEHGRRQAEAARDALAGIELDRVITSGLRRTLETAAVVAPGREPEHLPAFREIEGGDLRTEDPAVVRELMMAAFRGAVPNDLRFLGGETIGAFLDRVVPALESLVAEDGWDTALVVVHGGTNRAILGYALTGGRVFLGGLEQSPACINVVDVGADWIVRAVNHTPYDPAHRAAPRETTMELLWREYEHARSH
jgi:broad specificity phosphatase PhoE